MGRVSRVDVGGEVYHVLNRANARLKIFFKEKDYRLFEDILQLGIEKYDMRILAYCLMPNHFHLVLHPQADGDLQKFMQWITLTHTQRWHSAYKTIGTGHLYQGRYKSFVIEQDKHLQTVIRYVERNPLRANLVSRLKNWSFSSFPKRLQGSSKLLAPWPTSMPQDYESFVETALATNELGSLRYSVNRGKPFGTSVWTDRMIGDHALENTIRLRGRPRKGT